MKYILDKLRQPSTWAGIFAAVAGVLHFNVGPELQELVTGAGIALVSLALFFVREEPKS
jgi:drug/metabolite transporter (DMT)-like permease